MKRVDLERLVSNFTYRCLLSESIYDYKGSIKIIEYYIQSSKDLEEFVNLVKNDPRLENNQGYWELMREVSNTDEYNKLLKMYLAKKCDKLIVTSSDAGSLKIGNDDFKISLPNGFGDGSNNIYIFEKDINLECLKFKDIIEGNEINIYSYDCSNEVAYTLTGKYMVYSYIVKYNKLLGFNLKLGEKIFAFVKI